jgi:hypothetical protein
MRGHLFIIAGGATVAVGALAFAATAAYAAPIPTSSSAVAHSPALVVPANYHPPASTEQPIVPSGKGVVRVAPEAAVDIDGTDSHVTTPPSPSAPPVNTGGESAGAVPPATSTPPTSTGDGASGDDGSSNDGSSKGDGSNKGGSNNSGSNSGSDGNNKGKGKSNG